MVRTLFCVVVSLQLGLFFNQAFAENLAERFTIGSYNVSNLWDQEPDNTPQNWINFLASLSPRPSHNTDNAPQYPQFAAETSNYYDPKIIHAKVNSVLRGIELAGAPDILGMQEFESGGNLSRVWDMPSGRGTTFKQELEKMGYRYFFICHQPDNNPTSVAPALISRVPLTELQPIEVQAGVNPSLRSSLVVEWNLPGSRVIIINSHLKSKRDGGESLRILQAQTIRARINAEKAKDPHVRILMLGDLNSAYYDPNMAALGTTGDEASMLQAQGSDKLLNLWLELEEDRRWEDSYGGMRDTLSHILISHDFFNFYGLTYDLGSFHAVGQSGSEAAELLSADGTPFDWQMQGGRQTVHLGVGHSDHLPIVASFSYNPIPSGINENQKYVKRKIRNPFHESSTQPPRIPLFDHVNRCNEYEAFNAQDLDWSDTASILGKCVKIEADQALTLETVGYYRLNFVTFSYKAINMSRPKEFKIALGMTRSFDWRPNIDDARVSFQDAVTLAEAPEVRIPFDPHHKGPKPRAVQSGFNRLNPHPHSNQCYLREVLRGEGGRLKRIMGRVGYQSAELTIMAATREPQDLELIDLPENKQNACLW